MADLNETKLWCVHVRGPDTLVAQPSLRVATERAAEVNSTIETAWNRRTPSEFDPEKPVASVLPWPYTAEGHAADLDKHGGNPEDWC